MSKKYVHFSFDTEKEKDKKIIDYIEKEYGDRSLRVMFTDMIIEDMEKRNENHNP